MKLGLISLGCSKNLVDSENYIGMLVARKNFEITNDIDESEIVLINTCGFIGDAKEESIQAILEVAEKKKQGKVKKIIVAGCLAQRYSDELIREIKEIDAVIGNGDIDKIEEVVDTILKEEKIVKCGIPDYLATSKVERILTTKPYTAYIKISEGCNRVCAYCIIPKLRGKLRSRTIEDIVMEAKNLAENGVRELNILAQETTEYGIDLYGNKSLAALLKELSKVEKIDWIRVHYMYPNSITDELIDVIKNEPKICKYFDIPIQHISSNILKKMLRTGSGEQIRKILNKIRKEIPEAIMRTTLIVGFPGETEEDYKELKEFLEEFEFDYAGVFKYSREEDTIAYDLPHQISERVKEKRWAELTNLQSKIAEDKNRKKLGEVVEVIIDGVSSESEFMLEGRTRGQALDIDGRVLTSDGTAKLGEIVKVKLEQNFDYDFVGAIIENEDK